MKAWLLPQPAAADRYVEKGYNYMVMLNGANTIRIKAPVYDEDQDDHWVCNGNLYVTWTDDNGTVQKKSLLHFGFNYGKTGRCIVPAGRRQNFITFLHTGSYHIP